MEDNRATTIPIREEEPTDRDQIHSLVAQAFGREDEAVLVDKLRESDTVLLSLGATRSDDTHALVGHILFTKLPIVLDLEDFNEDGLRIVREETELIVVHAAALAPLAVLPSEQRKGVGSALVRRGLEELKKRGVPAVAVLGHVWYYPRFGFASGFGGALRSPYSGAGDSWMVLELQPQVLKGKTGTVFYAPPFKEALLVTVAMCLTRKNVTNVL